MVSNIIEVLTKTRDLIKEVGWAQGRARVFDPETNEVSAYCVLGALDTAAQSDYAAFDDAKFYLYKALPTKRISITRYNDKPKRTKRTIINWINKAIELAKQDQAENV